MIDISNWIIKDDNDDHRFQISPDMTLPSGAYLVICRDSLAFKNIHPHVNNVIGDLGFGLSGSGDMVRVYDNVGNIVDSVDYNVSEPWPYLPNGYGPTLELKNPDLDNSNYNAWESSIILGTPEEQNHNYISLDLDNEETKMPFTLKVGANFPNPFNINVSIPIFSSEAQIVKIKVYDILGRNIFEDRLMLNIGENIYTWNGMDKTGANIVSGIYFFHTMWGGKHSVNKIMCIK